MDQDEDKREELNELILDGGRYEEQVIYQHRKDIDPMFGRGRRCRPGCLPQKRPWRRLPCAGPAFGDVGRRNGRNLRVPLQFGHLRTGASQMPADVLIENHGSVALFTPMTSRSPPMGRRKCPDRTVAMDRLFLRLRTPLFGPNR